MYNHETDDRNMRVELMWRLDDKSKGKTFHSAKTIFNFCHIIWRKNLKFLCNNCIFFLPFNILIYKKKATNIAK